MCDCETEIYGIYGIDSYEMEGFKAINFEQILGVTTGYVVTSAVDAKIKAYAANKTGYMKHLQNTYIRSGAYAGAGLLANAFLKMPFVKDMGKGAIVYGAKEAIAKMMPVLGIGNPNSTVTIGNPNTTLRIEQPAKTPRDRSLHLMTNMEDPRISDARLTGVVFKNEAAAKTDNESKVLINH